MHQTDRVHQGRFCRGQEQAPPQELRLGRFSDGLEQLAASARRGSFADRAPDVHVRPGCFSDGQRTFAPAYALGVAG